jgi:hypothetical protein
MLVERIAEIPRRLGLPEPRKVYRASIDVIRKQAHDVGPVAGASSKTMHEQTRRGVWISNRPYE